MEKSSGLGHRGRRFPGLSRGQPFPPYGTLLDQADVSLDSKPQQRIEKRRRRRLDLAVSFWRFGFREIHHDYGSCCLPLGRRANLYWGVILIVVGVLWFLGNTGWMPVVGWEIVGPILIMAWGLSILASRRRDHTRNERPR